FGAALDDAQPGDAPQDRQGDVVADRAVQQQRLRLAFLGCEPDAGAQCVAGAAQPQRLAGDLDRARVDRYRADEGERQLGPARTDQSAEPDHFAGAYLDAHVAYVAGGHAAHREHHLTLFDFTALARVAGE